MCLWVRALNKAPEVTRVTGKWTLLRAKGLLCMPKRHTSMEGGCMESHRSIVLRIRLARHLWEEPEPGTAEMMQVGNEKGKIGN